MGNFRSDNREKGFNNRSSGDAGRSGGRGGFAGRNSGGRGGPGGRGGFGDRNSGGRGGFGDRNSGGRGGFAGRGGSGGRDSGRLEMHKATCSECDKQCEVPFKPSGNKPVLCSDCFRKDGGSSRSDSRDRAGPRGSSAPSGISQAQYGEINTKLDKILGILESMDFEDDDEESEDDSSVETSKKKK